MTTTDARKRHTETRASQGPEPRRYLGIDPMHLVLGDVIGDAEITDIERDRTPGCTETTVRMKHLPHLARQTPQATAQDAHITRARNALEDVQEWVESLEPTAGTVCLVTRSDRARLLDIVDEGLDR